MSLSVELDKIVSDRIVFELDGGRPDSQKTKEQKCMSRGYEPT